MLLTKKKILCVIPARGGSKGVPRKNIRLVAGKPLIYYSIRLAKSLRFLYKVIVSTDSKEIAKISKKMGAEVPFLRPRRLASDKAPMLPVLQHAVKFIEEKEGIQLGYVLLLQPTNPLRNKNDVIGCVKKIISTKADSVVAVSKVENTHPLLMKKIIKDSLVPYFRGEREGARRQDLKPYAYMRSGGIYLSKRDVLMTKNTIYGKRCRPYVIPRQRGFGIDDQIDLKVAEQLLKE